MSGLKKTLSVYQGIGILISTLLGSGIFIIPALVATTAGKFSTLSWIVMLGIIFPVAFTFGELGIQYPHTGGTSFFVKNAFGNVFENFAAWLYLAVIPLGPPVVIITGANYLGVLFKSNENGIFLISILMLISMFIISVIGIKFTSNIQTLITCVVVTILIFTICIGVINASESLTMHVDLTLNKDSIQVIKNTLPIMFWCFVGLEALAHLSSEFNDVKKDFPRTILIGLAVVGLAYLLLSIIILVYGTYGEEQVNSNYMVHLLKQLIGNVGYYIVGVLGFSTCFATVNSYILSFTRTLFSLSSNKVIPSCFAKTSSKDVPINALIPCFLLVTITVVLKFMFQISIDQLILCANSIFIALYVLATLSGIILLKGWKRVIAVLASAFCVGILIAIGINVYFILVIFLGSVLWDIILKYTRKLKVESKQIDFK